MARLSWAEPALGDLEAIAEYIALENPVAARDLVRRVVASVDRLRRFPESGKRPEEFPAGPYREIVVTPCRIFYRLEAKRVVVLHVMRGERELRQFLLDVRARGST